jgi:hypothetical protein
MDIMPVVERIEKDELITVEIKRNHCDILKWVDNGTRREYIGYTSNVECSKIESGKITAVLDIDSSELNSFDEVDATYLEKIVALI